MLCAVGDVLGATVIKELKVFAIEDAGVITTEKDGDGTSSSRVLRSALSLSGPSRRVQLAPIFLQDKVSIFL